MAFTLLLPWIRRLEDFYRFTQFLSSWTLLPSYAHFLSVTFTVLPQTHNFFIGVLRVPPPATCMSLWDGGSMSEGVRLGRARNAGIQDRRSLLFMNYIHARLLKRSLLVLYWCFQ